MTELARHEKAFDAFTDSFRTGDLEYDFYIDLKVEHTRRVYEIARKICARENLPEPICRLAGLAALYHDIGRFLQLKIYNTFDDSKSRAHAKLGVRALAKEKLLADLSRDDRRVVTQAVALHSIHHLPDTLPDPLLTVVRVVRDSDKLDIFPVMLNMLDENAPDRPVVSLGTNRHPTNYTPAIVEQIMARGTGNYTDMVWTNDFKLLVASWVYDLNFDASAQELANGGYIERIFSDLPHDPMLDALRARIFADLEARVNKNH